MFCLAGTTWALFSVSLDNSDNLIRISTAEVRVTAGDADTELQSGAELPAGITSIVFENGNKPDDLSYQTTLYTTLCFDSEPVGYVILDADNGYQAAISVESERHTMLTWITSWFPPAGAVDLIEDTVIVPGLEHFEEEAADPLPQSVQP